MDRVIVLKLACALIGLAVFGYGVRYDDNTIRWVGIALVVVAFLLRFVKKPPPEDVD